jgi:DNA-binding YbaB/EbfC family protein
MIPNLGQMFHLMKNAGQIRESARHLQEQLAAARHVGEAGGGQVRATVNGKGELLQLRIDPELVSKGQVEMIEELVVGSVHDAVRRSREALRAEIQKIGAGLDLGPLADMLGSQF